MNSSPTSFEIPHPGLIETSRLAVVTDIDDPEGKARVQVKLFDQVGDEHLLWAGVATPFAGDNRGVFFIPDVDDEVLVTFISGDTRFPIVIGGLWNGRSEPPDTIDSGRNVRKTIRSKNGVKLTLVDEDGQEKFIAETPGGQSLTLEDGPGKVNVTDSNGNSVDMEAAGITIRCSAKVTIDASLIEMSAGMVTVNAGLSKFSGVVQADTVISNSVISASYTPGAGNIW